MSSGSGPAGEITMADVRARLTSVLRLLTDADQGRVDLAIETAGRREQAIFGSEVTDGAEGSTAADRET